MSPVRQPEDLVAWRDPEPALQARNLALAYLNAGISGRSPAQIVRGYRMLTEVQRASARRYRRAQGNWTRAAAGESSRWKR